MDKILTPLTFRTMRHTLGFTTKEVADACSVNLRTAQRWENTKTPPMDAQIWLQEEWVRFLNRIDDAVEAADKAWMTTSTPIVLFSYLNEEHCQAKHSMSVARHQALLGHIGVALDMEEIPWDVVNIEDLDEDTADDPLEVTTTESTSRTEGTVYTTITDYITQVVEPALGEFVDDYDTEAIASDMLDWHKATDEDGNILLNHSGLVEKSDLDFWEVAARHDRTDMD